MIRPLHTPLLACLLLSLGTPALAQVQIGASKDNTLYNDAAGLISNGSGDHFFAGRNNGMSAWPIRRGLLAFDVAGAVPAGVQITSVQLTLSMSSTISGPKNVTLHRLTQDWGEGASDAPGSEGAGANAEAGDATWKFNFFGSSSWSTLGGTFVAGASASLPVDQTGFYTWGSTSGMVADVQSWLDSPATNFGWLLRGDESADGTAKRFDSRENPFPSLRPVLTVNYVAGAATYCTQTLPTSVPGCFASMSVSGLTLAAGTWDVTNIPRSGTLGAAGTTFGIYIYNDTTVGQSTFANDIAFGKLCLMGFKRSFPACSPLLISHPTWTPGGGACTTSVTSLPVDCNAGALGLGVGDDLNVQFWHRDPTNLEAGAARFSNAVFYTLL